MSGPAVVTGYPITTSSAASARRRYTAIPNNIEIKVGPPSTFMAHELASCRALIEAGGQVGGGDYLSRELRNAHVIATAWTPRDCYGVGILTLVGVGVVKKPTSGYVDDLIEKSGYPLRSSGHSRAELGWFHVRADYRDKGIGAKLFFALRRAFNGKFFLTCWTSNKTVMKAAHLLRAVRVGDPWQSTLQSDKTVCLWLGTGRTEAPVVAEPEEPEEDEESDDVISASCGCEIDDEGDKCSNCSQCPDCCECHGCDNCAERVDDDHFCSDCSCCRDCCECIHCNSCGRAVEGTCDNCEQCSHCCDCYYCEGCDSHVRDTCGDCDRCTDCCSCNQDGILEIVERTIKFQPPQPFRTGDFRHNKLRRYLSCEIEVDDCSFTDDDTVASALARWSDSASDDGSLSDAGRELQLSPTAGDLFIKHIDDVCKALNHIGADTNESCGLHVHVDARDFHAYDLQRFIKLYCHVEDALFGLVRSSRRDQSYSKVAAPFLRELLVPKFRKQVVESLLLRRYVSKVDPETSIVTYGGKLDEIENGRHKAIGGLIRAAKSEKYGGQYAHTRYLSCNIISWFFRGTIEFRHHHGTVNAARIKAWALTCGWLVETANRWTLKMIEELPERADEALLAVLPEELHEYVKKSWGRFDYNSPLRAK